MKTGNSSSKGLYYTNDHEWIRMEGPVAYIGICSFKLTGFRNIEQIVFYDLTGFKKRGDKIASIRYKDYRIIAHMPVDAEILEVNNNLISGNPNILLQQPESNGWISLIKPARTDERNGLLLPKEYLLNNKSINAKQ